ncbi:hypothetical protein ACLOJK_014554 [Asimina triloba]
MRPGSGLQGTKKDGKELQLPMLQVWQKRGSCPKGTVPIRRTRKDDVLRASSLQNFGRRTSHFFYHKNATNSNSNSNSNISFSTTNDLNQNHALGMLLTEGYRYTGARADISVWSPNVEFDDEYSDSMIFLRGGPYDDFDAIEAGWGVNETCLMDASMRLTSYDHNPYLFDVNNIEFFNGVIPSGAHFDY